MQVRKEDIDFATRLVASQDFDNCIHIQVFRDYSFRSGMDNPLLNVIEYSKQHLLKMRDSPYLKSTENKSVLEWLSKQ